MSILKAAEIVKHLNGEAKAEYQENIGKDIGNKAIKNILVFVLISRFYLKKDFERSELKYLLKTQRIRNSFYSGSPHAEHFKYIPPLENGDKITTEMIIRELYESLKPKVKAHVLGNSGAENDVDDVFHDSFEVLLNIIQAGKFTLTATFESFFMSICRNIWLNQLKKRKITPIDEPGLDAGPYYFEGEIKDQDMESRLFKLLEKLTERQKNIFMLFISGKSYAEISTIIGIKENNVGVTLKKTRDKLKKLIERDRELAAYIRKGN